ncbi:MULTISPECIES: hypothetical protein [unclassified Imperialibacter]|uniref:hypothetical protein n=1 Tax=unclassified Imperialibacter TaxID=2629706 RepID=UPI00125F3D4D|nr:MULTISPECIES: hypothetical protein [unclassified Imperialibacter]CAD5288618.1 hypothetical protein IMPERIA75_620010 [Imperialibacter sp. 75]
MKTISFTNSLRVPDGDPKGIALPREPGGDPKAPTGCANSLTAPGGDHKGMLFPKQAYDENDSLLVSLKEDTERVG